MSVSYILPLKAPSPLPATGVDIVTFKVWKNTLVAHIQQDVHHHHFIPGGLFSTWRAAEFGQRIQQLAATDPDRVTANGQRDQLVIMVMLLSLHGYLLLGTLSSQNSLRTLRHYVITLKMMT